MDRGRALKPVEAVQKRRAMPAGEAAKTLDASKPLSSMTGTTGVGPARESYMNVRDRDPDAPRQDGVSEYSDYRENLN